METTSKVFVRHGASAGAL